MIESKFELVTDYKPKGSQPEAIKALVKGINEKDNFQTLLGVTGSGKTFTIANVIAKTNKTTLVLAHNKTLAAQLYSELKELFPNNRVEFFVSYYDYYQPESYVPARDQYIEKDSSVNPRLEMMRHAATASLLSRKDTIVVASVSAIYSVGDPKDYLGMSFDLEVGNAIGRRNLIEKLVSVQYERNEMDLAPGRFRAKGDTIEFIPGYSQNPIRIELFGDEIERIAELDKITGDVIEEFKYFHVFAAKHFVVPEEKLKRSMSAIRKELEQRLPELSPLEAHRLKQRTEFDLEMIEEIGFCKGIENYSMHLEGRNPSQKPYCLLDYFPKDFLLVVDESHQTIPQIHGMYKGDRSRKSTLVDYGFRLPSALANRPLKFEEFEKYAKNTTTIFVSATPGKYEREISKNIVEQIIRPTGLLDPVVVVRPAEKRMADLKCELDSVIKRGDRALVTTITKRLAEELSEYLAEKGIKTRYLHSEIETLERSEIIRELRLGRFDVLVGINLLREGLDIPEVGFIGILDADKEGFLRDEKSLIQIIGRAARNANSKVVLYADRYTDSMKAALLETKRRRRLQKKFNKEHGITPTTIVKPVKEKVVEIKDIKHIPKAEAANTIIELEMQMQTAAENLEFERAIELRDRARALKERIGYSDGD